MRQESQFTNHFPVANDDAFDILIAVFKCSAWAPSFRRFWTESTSFSPFVLSWNSRGPDRGRFWSKGHSSVLIFRPEPEWPQLQSLRLIHTIHTIHSVICFALLGRRTDLISQQVLSHLTAISSFSYRSVQRYEQYAIAARNPRGLVPGRGSVLGERAELWLRRQVSACNKSPNDTQRTFAEASSNVVRAE